MRKILLGDVHLRPLEHDDGIIDLLHLLLELLAPPARFVPVSTLLTTYEGGYRGARGSGHCGAGWHLGVWVVFGPHLIIDCVSIRSGRCSNSVTSFTLRSDAPDVARNQPEQP
jgi:hypothetical protein